MKKIKIYCAAIFLIYATTTLYSQNILKPDSLSIAKGSIDQNNDRILNVKDNFSDSWLNENRDISLMKMTPELLASLKIGTRMKVFVKKVEPPYEYILDLENKKTRVRFCYFSPKDTIYVDFYNKKITEKSIITKGKLEILK